MNARLAQDPSRTLVTPGESPGRFLRHGAIWGIRFLSLVLVCGVFPTDAFARAFVHPGILHTRQDLGFMKRKVAARAEPWFSAWTNLVSQGTASLSFTGKPSAYLGDRDNGNEFEHAAYCHALQWAITGNRAHARKAIELINFASATIWAFQNNDAKLRAAWQSARLCNAAEILRRTDSGWSTAEIREFERFLRTVVLPVTRGYFPEANGNWDAAIICAHLSIGVFLDDRALFDSAIVWFSRGPGNGALTKYVHPSGQCQESARDQSHVQMGLGKLAEACQVAWNQGVDLYDMADRRLALGYEYTARYLMGEDVPAYGAISPHRREKLRDIYEALYQHYHFTKSFELPYTRRVLENTRSNAMPLGVLLSYRGGQESKRAKSKPAQPARGFPLAGALVHATAQPPTHARRIKPGEPIQPALDACAPGEWVVLEAGVHRLAEVVKLPSNVTLAGMGRESILFLAPDLQGPALEAARPDLHDVRLRDFVIEGGQTIIPDEGRPAERRDPNDDRRRRDHQGSPQRGGIDFSAQRVGQMRNLTLERLTVRHCTLDGVAIRGAVGVKILACDFSDNGNNVVPGPGLLHNLVLMRSRDCVVRQCRLDDSPHGNGVDISYCENVEIAHSEIARNRLNGIHAVESRKLRLLDNLAEGNDASGIACDRWMEGCRSVQIIGNIARNNANLGISALVASGKIVRNNEIADNGP